jgi:hypothetical protein
MCGAQIMRRSGKKPKRQEVKVGFRVYTPGDASCSLAGAQLLYGFT